MSSHLTGSDIEFVRSSLSMDEIIRDKIKMHEAEGSDEAFFVCDLGDVADKFTVWVKVFPRIKPFFAVKCNDDKTLLQMMALLGTGFDCASRAEIQKVLSIGVHPDRIVFANACKPANCIRFANKIGVNLLTFDNENELYKIKKCHPEAKLLLRLLPPATDKVLITLGNKYGCPVSDTDRLLSTARELELNVVGVSFHVGSGCYDAKIFRRAVEDSRIVFDMASSYGFSMHTLDVGGGFPGTQTANITLSEIANELNGALDELFPEGCGVDIIAEPGRYFPASASVLTTNVIAKRKVTSESGDTSVMYYVNDGVYGSFYDLLYVKDLEYPSYIPVGYGNQSRVLNSSIWGPTCDGLDKIIDSVMHPELEDGDWISFRDMGAYTLTVRTNFNGIPRPRVYYIAKISTPVEHYKSEISARDQFHLDMKSGHSVCSIIKPLPKSVGV